MSKDTASEPCFIVIGTEENISLILVNPNDGQNSPQDNDKVVVKKVICNYHALEIAALIMKYSILLVFHPCWNALRFNEDEILIELNASF